MSSYTDGLLAEFRAKWYLRFHRFSIVQSRYITGRHTGRAEIDIIARRGNLIIFCEVKKRCDIRSAFDAITYSQSVRLRRAATTWIARNQWRGDARFDVIAVCGNKIHWVKNAI